MGFSSSGFDKCNDVRFIPVQRVWPSESGIAECTHNSGGNLWRAVLE
ncbi:MAG: hypothetical protein ACI85F_002885 [Bacteroidia bacterium]|jgi:hypothetical protein